MQEYLKMHLVFCILKSWLDLIYLTNIRVEKAVSREKNAS